MPCRSDDCDYDYSKNLKNEIDELTKLLCYIHTSVTPQMWNSLELYNKSLKTWRIKHEAEDNARIAAEEAAERTRKLKQSALDKLNRSERIVLGIRE